MKRIPFFFNNKDSIEMNHIERKSVKMGSSKSPTSEPTHAQYLTIYRILVYTMGC